MPSGVRITKGKNLSMVYRRRGKAITPALKKAMRETLADARHAAEGLTNARAYNMGNPAQVRLRPYSRRRPRPPLPPGIINKQSGEFHRSWRTVTNAKGRTLSGTLYNVARHPIESRFTIPRVKPLFALIRKTAGPKYRQRVRRAVREALSKR
jgi:hypothetical protein